MTFNAQQCLRTVAAKQRRMLSKLLTLK